MPLLQYPANNEACLLLTGLNPFVIWLLSQWRQLMRLNAGFF
jgi:hypothetical protein